MHKTMHLGFDDTDSTRHGCTTYLAAILVERLERLCVNFLDYPNLIRLNPNVPWKTRGNGALCLRFEYNEEIEELIKQTAITTLEEQADIGIRGTDPGMVFFRTPEIPNLVREFAKKAETEIVTLKEAVSLIRKFDAEALGFNTCRGIIGALAAIGEILNFDHTFELIAYRTPENRGLKRRVDSESIFEMDRQTQPHTFNNVDIEKHRVIITPRGPDPILLGIRGETPEIVKQALNMVECQEPVERWVIFRTNQGTDTHLKRVSSLNQIRSHQSVIAKGVVTKNPQVIPLRHTVFTIKDSETEMDCAAYEPTGELRKVARELSVGDVIEVYGAVRQPHKGNPLTLNLEKIDIQFLAQKIQYHNPRCPFCGRNTESMGRGQGFRCKKCNAKLKNAKKVALKEDRKINPGLYLAATRSQRHMTKPLRRYGQEKINNAPESMVNPWHG